MTNIRQPKILFFFFAFCFSIIGNSQNVLPFRFSKITPENGLPHNNINAIVEDQKGFLWIGTNDGLSRIDGSNEVFNIKPSPTNTLRSSNIRSLLVDRSQNLWIGTRLGGLSKYNLRDDTWELFQHEKGNPNSLTNNDILSLLQDHKGNIWIGTEDGLNHYDTASRKLNNIKFNDSKNGLQSTSILDIHEDEQHQIWVGTWGGGVHLLQFEKEDNFESAYFIPFNPDLSDEASLNIWKIYQDSNNRFWIGTHGGGLFHMHVPTSFYKAPSDKKNQPSFKKYIQDDNDSNSIAGNAIADILQDSEGALWVASINGLSYLSANQLLEKGNIQNQVLSFQNAEYNPNDIYSISYNSINALHEDQQGIVWIGSSVGVNKYNKFTHQFTSHDLSEHLSKSPLSQNLYIDSSDKIWIGNRGNILHYNLASGSVSVWDKIKPTTDTEVKSMYKNEENIFFGTNTGLYIYNEISQKKTFHPFPKGVINKEFIIVRNIFQDHRSRVWLGTEQGLIIFHPEDGRYQFIVETKDPKSIVNNSVTQVIVDQNKDLWIATYDGLSKLLKNDDPTVFEFQNFQMSKSDTPNDFPSNQITCLQELNGKIYLGTTVGLATLDLKTEEINNLSFIENKISAQSLILDNNNELWIGTTQGLSKFNEESKTFNHYFKKDGLSDNTFNQRAVYKNKNGVLFFGSNKGFTEVDPDQLKSNHTPPNTYISHVDIIGQQAQKQINTLQLKEIELQASEYYISFNIASSNKNRPRKNKYKYKLEGQDEHWKESAQSKDIVYMNLKPGTYTFLATSSNNDGIWSNHISELKVHKLPYYWETWWFKVLSILVLSGIIYMIFRLYTNGIKEKNFALQKSNAQLSNEIKTRKRIEQELVRSNNDLEQFAYIASHDLQEPLRNVDNFVGLLEKKYFSKADTSTQSYFNLTKLSINRMFVLIKSVLTYSMVGREDTKFIKTDLDLILKEKLQDLRKVLTEHNVDIKYDKLPTIHCEGQQLGMVFQNILTNAIKYSDKSPCKIALSHEEGEKEWTFIIQDNGIGIKEEHLQNVFKIFTRLHNDQEYEGTGIGLALCQKIIERHKGRIWIESEFGQGSTFFFTIPKNLGQG